MPGACLVSDEQSLSLRDRDAESQPGGRDEVVFGHLHGAVQSATQTLRAFVQRTVQGVAGGGQRQRVSEDGVQLCAFESSAGRTAEGGASAVGVSVEQLSGIPQGSGAASGLAAGGSAAGGTRHPEGQPGWPRAICGADGGASGGGGWPGIPKDSAGLVLRGGSVSRGTVGTDGGPGRGESLRGGTAGERGGEGPADRGGGIEAVELDGVGVATAPQRRSEEGEDRAAIEGENDHDLEVDRRGVVHGGRDARIELAIAGPPWEEVTAR